MNTNALKKTMDWRTTGMVKGIKVKQMPVTGNACYYRVGSDEYGYQIGNVADDGTSFEMLDEKGRFQSLAVLVTRKNSRLCGFYCKSKCDCQGRPTGKPDFYYSCGCAHGALAVTQDHGCGTTYLDPSF